VKKEERLVCVFEPENYKYGDLSISSVALIDYNKLLGTFTIKQGIYKGLTEKDFTLVKGSYSLIYGAGAKLYVNRLLPKDLYIYIFSNRDINNMQHILGYSLDETYNYIAKHLSTTVLKPYDVGITNRVYRARFSEHEIKNAILFTDENIHEQLYGEKLEETKVSNTVSDEPIVVDTNQDIQFCKFDEDTQNLREVNKDDLLKALPQNLLEIKKEEIENDSNFNIDDINILEIMNDINKEIVGQESAIKALVTNIYYNQVLLNNLDSYDDINPLELDSRKINILLDGSTGTGKTAIANAVARKFNLPLVVGSAKSFSETGYVGPTITDMLKKLIIQANNDIRKAERGIIILDEIDKIAVEHDRNSSMKKGVQEELLTFIGGGKYDIKVNKNTYTFDTSKITFILMGAFTDIREEKIKKNESSKIGFGEKENNNRSYTITADDYIKYGLMREFFGRIKVIATTKTYTKEDLTNILLNSTISPLKNLEKSAQMFGYGGITYDEELIKRIVDEAYEKNTGARALQTVVAGIQDQLLLEMITNNVKNENKKMEITGEVLENYKKAKIIKY